jgi:hypothetical protein
LLDAISQEDIATFKSEHEAIQAESQRIAVENASLKVCTLHIIASSIILVECRADVFFADM